ncbi:Metal-dependent carboxypeptidase [Planctomycetales bacterium 10988]|nr:Metal-dependent carboxypeptidase [Planctomycetales bacterium 10988]
MSATDQANYQELRSRAMELSLLGSIESVLGWDERVMLPELGAPYRAEQMTMLAGKIHQSWTDPRMGELIESLAESELANDPESDSGATIRELKKDYDRRKKLPEALVKELTRLSVLGQQAWQKARETNNWNQFSPFLAQIVEKKREEAQAIGYEECPYDALLDEYEPGEKTSQVAAVLAGLKEDLVPFIQQIADSGKQTPVEILSRYYPAAVQESFGKEAANAIGFDFQRGRLDETAHPFCSGMGPNDCRITTRYNPNFFNEAFFGILHEAGHGLYDQGLRADEYGLPLGSAVSLGIHESQSRMWENFVGRSLAFWKHFYPAAQLAFPEALGNVKLESFYFAINAVEPSLIRVEADEATYNLHILVRFELEQALINDGLSVADLPQAWNSKYESYLGLTPPSDTLGVLQDIHWSGGAIGYFTTYSLGNLYAAQFFEQADREIGPLQEQFAAGVFQPLKEWLQTKIHQQGRRYSAAQLVEKVTGKPLSHQALMRHLHTKLDPLYDLN